MNTVPSSPAAALAQKLLNRIMERLSSIDASLVRLVELGQGPREMLFAAGSVPFGGTVGISPSSCTVAPPLGMPAGVVLAANPHRRGLSIQNLSAVGGANLTLGLGVMSPQPGTGFVLPPGASWDGRVSGAVWPGSVTVVASAAACVFAGLEVLGPNERRRNLPL